MEKNYERQLLEKLLEKYEKSKAFTGGHSSRRIALTLSKEERLQREMENPEEKRLFLSVLAALKKQGLVDYSWVRFEEGNLVDKIWLIQDEDRIRESYRRTGRIPLKEKADGLQEMVEKYAGELKEGTALRTFLEKAAEEIQIRKKPSAYFPGDQTLNEDILKCLIYMENNEDEQMERLMSLALYGDSKRFEKEVKTKVLSILKGVKREAGEDIPEDEELLREKGIVRWPEILEFTGRIQVLLKDGCEIDYSKEKYGAYINAETVLHVSQVRAKGVRRVLFIENKANYVWYLSHGMTEEELVIFHGGCYSPVKGKWFRKISEGLKYQPEKVEYYHWGDMDVGGFRIFQRLRKNIIPELKPYRMDLQSLERYRDKGMKITSPSYAAALEKMGQDPEYACFHQVIARMVEEKIRLEQEVMILTDSERKEESGRERD
ncbi:MAG: Wadjet anti-phage system protein JetD domain-containing protein [Ruminococcus sp.]|jgi:hypothetical protein